MSEKNILINQICERLQEITKYDNDGNKIEDSFKRLLSQLETLALTGEKENKKYIMEPPKIPVPPPLPNMMMKKNEKKIDINVITKESPKVIPPPPPPPATLNSPSLEIIKKKKVDSGICTSTSNVPDPPSKNLKCISWLKIDDQSPKRGTTIWDASSITESTLSNIIDFAKIEEYFKIENNENKNNTLKRRSNKKNNNFMENEIKLGEDNKNEKAIKIKLLSDKKIMNLDIFLKQFKSDKLLPFIIKKESSSIGLERLKILQSYLPDEDETKLLKEFSGSESVLTKAEIFLRNLIKITNYKQIIFEMIFSEFLTLSFNDFPSQLQCVINAAKEILQSKNLQKILVTALEVGNYLNRGKMYGNAAGIKLKGIEKFGEFKTAKNDKNFIEVIEEVTRNLIECKDIIRDFEDLEKVQLVRLEIIDNEFKELEKGLISLKKMCDNGYECDSNLINKGELFIKQIKDIYETVELKKRQLCDYFQENIKDFQLEPAFKIVFNFVKLYRNAQKESRQVQMDNIIKDTVSCKVAQFENNNEIKKMPSFENDPIKELKKVLPSNISHENSNELENIFKKRKSNKNKLKSKDFICATINNTSNLEDFLNESLKDGDTFPILYKTPTRNSLTPRKNEKISSESIIEVNNHRQKQISPSQSEISLSSNSSKNSDDEKSLNVCNLKKNSAITISSDDGFESDNRVEVSIEIENKKGKNISRNNIKVDKDLKINTLTKSNQIIKKVDEVNKPSALQSKRNNINSKLPINSNKKSPVVTKQPIKKVIESKDITKQTLPITTNKALNTLTASTASRPQIIRTGKPTKSSTNIASKEALASKIIPQPRMTRATILAKKAKEEAMKNQKKDRWL
uniref:FH2 domain-containing protein n=1 Tax=Parastrongyloides trichosuri TaxID=131310 RepID=A0A0N4Z226_PARTI